MSPTPQLIILHGLLQDELVAALAAADHDKASCLLAQNLRFAAPTADPAGTYLLRLLLQDANFLACQAAQGRPLALTLPAAYAAEVAILQGWLADYNTPSWLVDDAAAPAGDLPSNLINWRTLPADEVAARMIDFHRNFGYGQLALHRVWRWQGALQPVVGFDDIRLTDLVGYQHQKDEVMNNTRLFVRHGRGNNMLLYGARGTGKSSLIKAVANELADEGLCLVELPLDHIADLPHLQALLKDQPRHYIIYIDDLSFEKADQSYKITKAVLEGSVTARGGNVLIYATSNRRHLIVENWQDREGAQHNNGEVRASDSMSEKLSLADRFGQTVLFTTPRQDEYLNIVAALAAADGITLPSAQLREQALQWALWQNGCSGRTARQFVNSLINRQEDN